MHDVRAAAKAAARQERDAARQAQRLDRERAAAARREARAAARVDSQLSEQHAPELLIVDEPTPAPPRDADAFAPHETARQERAEAREAARLERQARRAEKQDHIVEAPREPRKSLLDRWRASSGRAGGTDGGRRVLPLTAGVIGALALLCSFVLALGALLVALGAGEGSSAYDTLTALCDGLVGPLRDVFSFSGTDAQMKESLVAWGTGSMGYLVVGVLAQSFRRARLDD